MTHSNMYTYYLAVRSNEHMLFAKELAEKYGIYSSTGNPHNKLIKVVIIDYLIENNIPYRPLFYETKSGLREVFSQILYEPAFERFINKASGNKYTSLNKITYYFKNNTIKGEI